MAAIETCQKVVMVAHAGRVGVPHDWNVAMWSLAMSRRNSRAVTTNTGRASPSCRMLTGTLNAASSGSAASGACRSVRASTSTARITPSPQTVSVVPVLNGLMCTGDE